MFSSSSPLSSAFLFLEESDGVNAASCSPLVEEDEDAARAVEAAVAT